MSDLPFLLLMIAVPAIGAAVVAALPEGRDELARQIALALSLVVLLLGRRSPRSPSTSTGSGSS